MSGELVPDPGFDDASKWTTADVVTGTAVVAGGTLTCTNYQGRVISVPEFAAVIGRAYTYEIVIDSTDITGLQAVQFGNEPLWSGLSGAGNFSGTLIASATNALNIVIAFTPGNLVINRISIEMAHVRQQIREAAKTLLTGLSTTGANVFKSKVYNVQESELPCLLVYTNDEAIDDGSFPDLIRSLQLTIQGKAQETSNLDDKLDDIAAEVEVAMAADITIGGLVVSSGLTSTNIELPSSGESDQPIGSISLNYDVTYMTPNGNPTTVST